MAFAPITAEKTQYAGAALAVLGLGAAAAAHFTGKSLAGIASKHIFLGSLATAGVGVATTIVGRVRSSIPNSAIEGDVGDREDGAGALFFLYPELKSA